MTAPILRILRSEDYDEFAQLICDSMNQWYTAHAMGPIFPDGPAAGPRGIVEIYETLDPGCCVVAEDAQTRRLLGGCFWHKRTTHVSLGMMAVHPAAFKQGVGKRLVRHITDIADGLGLPTRLVSSAMNLDSFSLYNRCGFVPRSVHHDILLTVPATGLPGPAPASIRTATHDDVESICEFEESISSIRRAKDFYFFAEFPADWHVALRHGDSGKLDGVLVSHITPGTITVGPGFARDSAAAIALLHHTLHRLPGRTALVLPPADAPDVIRALYQWGGRNIELHFFQCRGEFKPFKGVTFPTFMPETG